LARPFFQRIFIIFAVIKSILMPVSMLAIWITKCKFRYSLSCRVYFDNFLILFHVILDSHQILWLIIIFKWLHFLYSNSLSIDFLLIEIRLYFRSFNYIRSTLSALFFQYVLCQHLDTTVLLLLLLVILKNSLKLIVILLFDFIAHMQRLKWQRSLINLTVLQLR